MGFDPSMESGLEKILEAANEGKWSWIEAKSILCNLYLWVEDDPLAFLPHAEGNYLIISQIIIGLIFIFGVIDSNE